MGILPPIQAWTFKRSGSLSANPTLFAQKSTAFASAALSNYSTVTIIATRDEEGVHGYLVGRGRLQMDDAALQLAHSVGAKVERIEEPPQLRGAGAAVVGRLHYVHGESGGLIQAGADPADVIRTLAQSMPHGSWVGASMRRPTRYEKSRWFEYLKSRPSASASHHTRQTNFPVITSIYAGTATRTATRALLNQVAGSLPGFDMNVATQVPNRFSTLPLPWLVPAALFGLTHAHKLLTALDQPLAASRFAELFTLGLVQPAVIAAAGASLLLLLGVLPSRWSRLMSAVRRGTLPRPYHRAFRARKGKVADFQHRSQMGEYPLDNRSFMVAPHLLTTLVAPHAGALSGSSSTRSRAVPHLMTTRIGPMIGRSDSEPVYLSARDAAHGVATVGRPGSGKALDLATRIPVPVSDRFPEGWARNDELGVGDTVFTADGSVTEVVRLSETFVGEVYELTFSDGQKVRADAGHLWTVTTRAGRTGQCNYVRSAREVNVTKAAELASSTRAMARSLPPGTFATVSDLARMIDRSDNYVAWLARAAGIEGAVQNAAITSDVRPIPHRRHAYSVGEFLDRHCARPVDPRSKPFNEVGLAELKERAADWLSPQQLAAVLTPDETGRQGEARVRARLHRLGVARRLDVVMDQTVRPVTRNVMTYPAAEYLYAYAERIEHQANRAAPLHTVVSTRTIVETLRKGDGRAEYGVTLPDAVDTPDADLPLDPYVLGAWLGDGTNRSPSITSADKFIVNEIIAAGFPVTSIQRRHATATAQYYTFPSMRAPLRATGHACKGTMTSPKRIPAIYMRASSAQRLALLQGLMDTDGSVSADGSCEFVQADLELTIQVQELARSLGIKTGPVHSAPSHYTIDGRGGRKERHAGRGKHRLMFTTGLPVFRLPRKLDRLHTDLRSTQSSVFITGAKRIENAPVRCITVADPSATFLIEGFLPTHNSVHQQNLFAWSMLERTQPCGEDGFPGAKHALIAFEPKLDGAEAYLRWAQATGDVVRVVEVANPAGESIDLFDVPGTVADRAEFFTEALRYAFDDGAIQGASAEALRAVLGGGLVVTDDMVGALHRGPQGADPVLSVELGRSPIYYAHVLLGGLGDVPAVALAKQINLAAAADRAEGILVSDAIAADARLTPIFERTPAARSTYSQAPRNKLDALMSVEHFFGPHRPKHTWSDVLTNHRALVVLTGVDSAGHMMSTSAEKLMSSLLMYSLRDAIERTCTGWEAAGRWVSVFVDELSMIAGNDPEIITWLKNRGRSYGVRPIFATQYPTQLNPQVREAFLSFSTLLTYTLDNPTIAAEVVSDLSGDGTEWTVTDVLELAPYHALVRANVARQRQPGFSVRAEYWAGSPADRARFVTDQGYTSIASAPTGLGIAS